MPDTPASDAEIAALIDVLDRGRDAWIHGRMEWTVDDSFAQDPGMTIFGPFGGEAATADPERQQRIAADFRGGTGHTQIIGTISEGDLLVIVAVEWNRVTFVNESTQRPWILRTTQVFRRDRPGHWLRLHRHADPLITRRSLEETLALLEGARPPS